MQDKTFTNHYGHNVDITGDPFYCTDCEELVYLNEQINDEDVEKGMREWYLGQYTTNELNEELERRGYVNGVLMHPELDKEAV